MSKAVRMKLGPKGFRTKRLVVKSKLPKYSEYSKRNAKMIDNSLDEQFGTKSVPAAPFGSVHY